MPNDFHAREHDPTTPTSARLYHGYLTGETFYTIDRVMLDRVRAELPILHQWAVHNREFLARAVSYMAAHGVRQFLDIGSGLPTAGNTHQVARQTAPDARVVYVDKDLDAVTRSHALLREENGLDRTTIIEADLRDPQTILHHPETARLIDFTEPVGLLIVSVLPFIADDDRPKDLIAQVRDRLASGSYFAATHVSMEDADTATQAQVAAAAGVVRDSADPVTLRDRATFVTFFEGLDVVEPGVTYATDWQPTHPVDPGDPARKCNFAAVGRKT
ncbi:SAM-dependent methyltransferase [Nocardia puris]|uniref:SAM-dependent methyltransferase n=1 Tax=Nocardia puris TaxID=208602 RepID=UPI001893552E|nr:SAM-dependent methyltransferase [Nocardia puris]MBF6369942.1 SAM-dependent methyltransferase [Nocardia puris]